MKPGEAGFARGGIAALIALYAYHAHITEDYKVVIQMYDRERLLRIAKRDGDMKASGLGEYQRRYAVHPEY